MPMGPWGSSRIRNEEDPSAPAPAPVPTDPMASLAALADRFRAPPPTPHESIDPALADDTASKSAMLQSLQGLVGLRTVTEGDVRHGLRPGVDSSPGYEAAQKLIGRPLANAQAGLASKNQNIDTLNKFNQQHQEDMIRAGGQVLGNQSRADTAAARMPLEQAKLSETTAHHERADATAKYKAEHPAPRAGPKPPDLDKFAKELGTDLDPSGTRAGEFGKLQGRLNAFSILKTLISEKGGGTRDLDKREMEEFAIGFQRAIAGGGQGSEFLTRGLIPRTMGSDLAPLKEYFQNIPAGTNQREFVKKMGATTDREIATVNRLLRKVQTSRLPRHLGGFKNFPKESPSIVAGYGLDPAKLDFATGKYTETLDPEDQEKVDWLKANPGHKDAAKVKAVLEANGVL